MDELEYYVDLFGRLWKGPTGSDNLHYAVFHGFMTVPPHDPIWVLERSEPPEDADRITDRQAEKAMDLYRGEWF